MKTKTVVTALMLVLLCVGVWAGGQGEAVAAIAAKPPISSSRQSTAVIACATTAIGRSGVVPPAQAIRPLTPRYVPPIP